MEIDGFKDGKEIPPMVGQDITKEEALKKMPKPPKRLLRAPEKIEKLSNKKPGAIYRHWFSCGVCQHKRALDIHQAIINWSKLEMLAQAFDVTVEDLKRHEHFFKLSVQKYRNTEALYERIIEHGMNNMDRLEIKAKDVIHAAERLDKLTGREVKKLEISGPPVVNFIGVPAPGGIAGKRPEKVIEGKVIPALPSFSGSDECKSDKDKDEKDKDENKSHEESPK